MNKQERDESRKICEAAPGGPWEAYCATVVDLLVKKCVVRAEGKEILPEMPIAIGCFVAHARTALPKALDLAEKLEEDSMYWLTLSNDERSFAENARAATAEMKAERDRYKRALKSIVGLDAEAETYDELEIAIVEARRALGWASDE